MAGYTQLSSDGGVFSSGAPFEGSQAQQGSLPDPVTAIIATSDGSGYVFVPSDPAVEPGVAGLSGYALARRQWVDYGNLVCAAQSAPCSKVPSAS